MQPKPDTLAVHPEQIPEELRRWPQWVVWRWEWKPDKRDRRTGALGAWDKPPYSARTGVFASSTDRRTWASFEEALAKYQAGGYDGVGFCPTDQDPFVIGDFDDYVSGNGVVDPKVMGVVHAFASYAELSPSGTGVRLIVQGEIPGGRGRNNRQKRAELYDRGHYLTITGHALNGSSVIAQRQAQIEQLLEQLKPQPKRADPVVGGDVGLLQRARSAKNGAKFSALYDDGDTSEYRSGSEADMALCSFLAFWCRKEPAAMDRLFRGSHLMREKWDEQHGDETYGAMTIRRACETTNSMASPGADGHEAPTGLSYYSRGRQRIWVIHFPFGDVEIANGEIAKWAVVEAACTGGPIARLPEYEPTVPEWRSWLRLEMPKAEELPELPELDERGRTVSAVLQHLSHSGAGAQPRDLTTTGVWLDTANQRYIVSAGMLRGAIDNQYKPWLTLPLMNSVLRQEFRCIPWRVWLPSGSPTRQDGDETRPHVVIIPEGVVDGLLQ